MKRHQIITLIFFVLILGISTRVGNVVKTQAYCMMYTTIPTIVDNSKRVIHMIFVSTPANLNDEGPAYRLL